MNHIEVLGAPGTGKTTIHRRLTESNDLYGGYSEEAYSRYFIAKNDGLTKSIFKNSPNLCQRSVTSIILYHRYQNQAFELFFRDYPSVIRLMALASELLNDKDIEIPSMVRKVSDYQISKMTTKGHEILCLDQSFHQRLMGYLWRLGTTNYPQDDYLDSIPTPMILIHFVCPPETALARQQNRERRTVNKSWVNSEIDAQRKLHEICRSIAEFQERKTNVIEISTDSDIHTTMDKVKNQLEKLDLKINYEGGRA